VTLYKKSGGIAQSVEQGTENPCVASSILAPATIFFTLFSKNLTSKRSRFFFWLAFSSMLLRFCINGYGEAHSQSKKRKKKRHAGKRCKNTIYTSVPLKEIKLYSSILAPTKATPTYHIDPYHKAIWHVVLIV
jgi:hypothetical protein